MSGDNVSVIDGLKTVYTVIPFRVRPRQTPMMELFCEKAVS